MEETKTRAETGLKYIDRLHIPSEAARMEQEIHDTLALAIPRGSTHDQHFQWTDAGRGAARGWHTTLTSGVWVNGVKILRNQPVLLDVNCPFILAPAGPATRAVYESIPGARSLSSVTSLNAAEEESDPRRRPFYAFPCLNEIDIAVEIAGRRFPVARGPPTADDTVHGPAGGRFSLGPVDMGGGARARDAVGTGYCVGIVVGTTMGGRPGWRRAGMRDVWVLGEPFFRGLGVAFDLGDARGRGAKIGVRVY